MPKPIFVVGKGRSGTTWLTNMLATHPDIAGVFNEDKNKGIKESRYFSDLYGRYGDLRNPTNLVEFIEILAVTDYFRLM